MVPALWDLNLADWVQMTFWLVVGTLSILTYRQARKSVFVPIRTEVFKLQLTAMTRVSEMFTSKGEYDLQQLFDFDAVLDMNREYMLEVLRNPSRTSNSQPPGTTYTYDFNLVDELEQSGADVGDPGSYKHRTVFVTGQFRTAWEEVTKLCADPLLPEGLVRRMQDLLDDVYKGVEAVMTSMERSAKLAYSTGDLQQHQVRAVWLGLAPNLAEAGDSIVSYIRNYFEPESLRFGRIRN